jgi:cell division septum initiation protein DivIVA
LSVGAGDVQERLETLLEERKALGEEVKRLEKAVRGSESSGDRRSLRPL